MKLIANKIDEFKENLQSEFEKAVRKALVEAVSSSLKNHTIVFDDSMGVDIVIQLRSGREFVIVPMDQWFRGKGPQPFRVGRMQFVQNLQAVLTQYEDMWNDYKMSVRKIEIKF